MDADNETEKPVEAHNENEINFEDLNENSNPSSLNQSFESTLQELHWEDVQKQLECFEGDPFEELEANAEKENSKPSTSQNQTLQDSDAVGVDYMKFIEGLLEAYDRLPADNGAKAAVEKMIEERHYSKDKFQEGMEQEDLKNAREDRKRFGDNRNDPNVEAPAKKSKY